MRNMLLGMLDMVGNYQSRVVARWDSSDNTVAVSTAAVTDSTMPYETAVMHPRYNRGRWVIVEMYGTKAQAQAGHERWLKTIQTEPLPEQLTDVSTADVAMLCDELAHAAGEDEWRVSPFEVSEEEL